MSEFAKVAWMIIAMWGLVGLGLWMDWRHERGRAR